MIGPLPCAECSELVPPWDEVLLGDFVFHPACADKYLEGFTMALKGLPVPGYKDQTTTNVALVSHFKRQEERLLREMGEMKDMPDIDQRWLAIARTQIEQGYMALNRSVFKPDRVELPEDSHA